MENILNYGYHIRKDKTFYHSIKKEYENNMHFGPLKPNSYQIFLKTPQRKALSKINDKDKQKSKKYVLKHNINLFIHGGYLFNIGDTPTEYSINTAVDDIVNGGEIGAQGAIFHVGKHCNRCTPDECRANMIEFINTVISKSLSSPSKFILETGANCGTEVCRKLEDLKFIYDHVEHKEKFGFCIDTCHIFAAGFDIRTEPLNYINHFDRLIGTDKVMLIHLNDSKGALGSHLDRHQTLTMGKIGKFGLREFVKYFGEKKIPLVLETPDNIKGREQDRKLILDWFFE